MSQVDARQSGGQSLLATTLRSSLAAALVVVASGAFLPATAPIATPSRSEVGDVLERYGKGEFDLALADLTTGRTLREVARSLRREGPDWLARDPTEQRPRRLAVLATVAIEVVARSVEGLRDDYDDVKSLIEWICELFRRGGPSEFERLFHLASIAQLQAAKDDLMLIGFYGGSAARGYHVYHAARRFPNEGRFALAWITTRTELRTIAPWPVAPGALRYSHMAETLHAQRDLEETLRDITRLVDHPTIGLEARLRRGILRFEMDRTALATADLRDASQSADPFVKYLSWVMLGLIAEQAGQVEDAIDRYRAAVRVVPATAASMALASLLFRQGRGAEANEIVSAWTTAPRPDDPWRLYGLCDYRLFAADLQQMRTALLR